MPVFIRLGKLTEEGARTIKNSTDRPSEVKNIVESNGGKLIESWRTSGPYDTVSIFEAPDNATMLKINGLIGAQGHSYGTVMCAMPSQEAAKLFK